MIASLKQLHLPKHSSSFAWRAALALTGVMAYGCAVESSPSIGNPGKEASGSDSTPASPSPETARSGSLADFVGTATVNGITIRYKVVDGLAIAGGDINLGPVDEKGQLIHRQPAIEASTQPPPAQPPPNNGSEDIGQTRQPLTGIGTDPRDTWWLAKGWQWPPHDFGSWGFGGCTIPYVFDSNMPADFIEGFRAGVAWFAAHTSCVWEERSDPQVNVVVSYSGDLGDNITGRAEVGRGCYYATTRIGRWVVPWLQCDSPTRSLQLASNDFGPVTHEMFHILGFWHEHQRPDRNLYVDVLHIGPDFDPFSWDAQHVTYFSDAYDTNSIMEYKGHCTWYEFLPFVGVWGCWGSVLPKGFSLKNGSVDADNYYEGYTVSVGGDAPDGLDVAAVDAMYPPPPYKPPPPPPPEVDCSTFHDWNACAHGSTNPCC